MVIRFGPKAWITIAIIVLVILLVAWLADAATRLVVFHNADGREIIINPAEVTSLRAAREPDAPNRAFTKEVECMISLTDGKFVTVVEDCDAVRKSVEDAGSLK